MRAGERGVKTRNDTEVGARIPSGFGRRTNKVREEPKRKKRGRGQPCIPLTSDLLKVRNRGGGPNYVRQKG